MLRCTDKSKLIRLLEMLEKEAKLEQGRLPSEETGCVYECSMGEDATHVLSTDSLDVDRGFAVLDGMVILNKMQNKCNLVKTFILGMMPGERRRGHPRMQYIDNIKKWTRTSL